MIQISQRADYAFFLLGLLARSKQPVALKSLAEEHDMSFQYLQEVAQQLRRAGFICSTRGTHGGYHLDIDPAEVSVLEIIHALEGTQFSGTCQAAAGNSENLKKQHSCARASACPSKEGLALLKNKMLGLLAEVTLADMFAQKVTS